MFPKSEIDSSVGVVEKGSEVDALLETRAIHELFQKWNEQAAPLNVPVTEDKILMLLSDTKSQEAPHWMV